MKKITILLILLLTFTAGVGAADFRDVSWGMSRDEVVGREGQPVFESDTMVAYEVELFDVEFALGFMFYEGTLTNARYMLMGDPVGTEYKYLIEDLDAGLTKKYGEPEGRGLVWLDDYYKHKPGKFHSAVKSGDVIVQKKYEDETTNVLFGVMGQGYEDQFFVMYEPKDPKYQRMIEKREQEEKGESESQL